MKEQSYKGRSIIVILLAALMLLPLAPAAGVSSAAGSVDTAGAREVEDGHNLIVPKGETYELCGCHTYPGRVEIDGTLVVKPYDGTDESTGTLVIRAGSIFIGATGKILADGRGYGGGGGGQSDTVASPGGSGGTGGKGGNGAAATSGGTPTTKGGGGGGGSNGGKGGAGNAAGSDGTESGGGKGGTCSSAGGAGGSGYGGGGGGGGSTTVSGGGGGGGGSGGASAFGTTGGKGAGEFGGAGGPGTTGTCSASQNGQNGGYMGPQINGDTTTDLTVVRGSGGGGGGASSGYGGGAGGGGAGGAAVTLIAEGELKILGSISSTGGGGGKGGVWGSIIPDPDDKAPGPGPVPVQNTGGSGGGGAGGGIALMGMLVTISGTIDARGRLQDTLSTQNGGSVKIFYAEKTVTGSVQGGRVYYNGRPTIEGLSSPANGSYMKTLPTLSWKAGSDPDGDAFTYAIQVSSDESFETILIERAGITGTQLSIPEDFRDGTYWWRVRGEDAIGPGGWTPAWRFTLDRVAPQSYVVELPEYTTTSSFEVSWSAEDEVSGILDITVYVCEDESGFRVWQEHTLKTSERFEGEEGHRYAFYSVARDRAGNEEAPPLSPDAFTTIDTIPPSSSILPLSPYQTEASFTVRWNGKDATSGISDYTVYVSVDGGSFSPWLEGTRDTEGLFDGAGGHEYTFYVRARDRAGLVEPEPSSDKMVRTKVDLKAPATTLAIGQPKYGEKPVFVSPSTVIQLTAKDDYAGVGEVLYSLDGGAPTTYSGPIKGAPPGHHNLTYWSADLAGNVEEKRSVWFFVDGEAPVTELVVEGRSWANSGRTYLSGTHSISLRAMDWGSGVARTEVGLDGSGYSLYEGPISFTGGGAHTLRFRSQDNLGTLEEERELTFVVDTTPPSTIAQVSMEELIDQIVISLQAQDTQSGVAGTWYRVLKGEETIQDWTEGTSVVVATPLDHSGDGTYTVEFYSEDNVGNREETKKKELVVDTLAELYTDQPEKVTVSKERYVLSGRVEPGSKVTLNGKSITVGSDGSFSVELELNEGANEVELKVTDPAGNERSEVYRIIYNRPATAGVPTMLIGIVAAGIVAIVLVAVGLVVYRKRRAK
ncbi:MAG: hypothetical protein QW379_02125 [Thermoplasmata archaeon]